MRFYGRRRERDCAAANPRRALGRIRGQGHKKRDEGSLRRLPVVRKLPVLLAVLTALAFGLVACGDDESEDTTAAEATTEAETTTEETTAEETTGGGGGGGGETVALTESDFAIDPAEPTVAAGTVTFEISNDGQSPHNIEIEGNGIEELSDTFEPGASGELTVELEPGTYEMYCAIGNHRDLGMDGEVTVQ
jgi:plastocyanin